MECYYSWKGRVETELDVQSPPNCFNGIVINCGDDYKAIHHSTKPVEVPSAFVCGLFTSNYHLVLNGTIEMVGIVLKPGTLNLFYNFTMSNLVNSRVPLELFFGETGKKLAKQIKDEQDDERRIVYLEEFILSGMANAINKPSIIDEAIELMDTYCGCKSVEEVAEKLKISKRYLEKKFLEKVGVSPKFYSRIKRFTTLSKEVAYNKNLNWQDLVQKYGFHDQSHLVKEFMEFNKMNPSTYLNSHQELIRFVKR